MATIKGPPSAKSSPHSSDEASPNDTPSTNLTAFSPGSATTATGPRPKFNLVLAEPDGTSFNSGGHVDVSYVARLRLPTVIAYMRSRSNDPFINLPTPTSAHGQLSPTAEVFAPRQYIATSFRPASATNNHSHFNLSGTQPSFGGYSATHGRVSSLVATSFPEARSYPIQARHGAVGDHPNLTHLYNGMHSLYANGPSEAVQNFRDAAIAEGTFTTDDATTRAFMVTNIPPGSDFCRVAAQFPVSPLLVPGFRLSNELSR